ncbi:MAG TPA: hypothetical protein VIY48_04565, partial [Candidatus Paceibacterota bacterium]
MKKTAFLVLISLLVAVYAWAGTYTTNYNLYKPATGELNWGTKTNGNWDTIDSLLWSLSTIGTGTSGGSMTWPIFAGIPNYNGSLGWG